MSKDIHLAPQKAKQHVEAPTQASEMSHHEATQASLKANGADSSMDVDMTDMPNDSASGFPAISNNTKPSEASSESDRPSSRSREMPSRDALADEDAFTTQDTEESPGMNQAQSQAQVQAEDPGLNTAVQKVFTTYELVEQILLKVSAVHIEDLKYLEGVKTVLLAQRVDRTFQHVIRRSVKLQRALFFKANPSKKVEEGRDGEMIYACWNPLFFHPDVLRRIDHHFKMLGSRINVFVNPEDEATTVHLSAPSDFAKRPPQDDDAPLVVESWKRMLLCQDGYAIGDLKVLMGLPWIARMVHCRIKPKCTMGMAWDKVLGAVKPGEFEAPVLLIGSSGPIMQTE